MTTPPPLPATCSVEALAEWLNEIDVSGICVDYPYLARAVRALLEDRVRSALDDAFAGYPTGEADSILSRVLGAAK